MKDFIKQQQELARKELGEPAEGYSHYNVDGCTVERLIEQAITNTGEELMRKANEDKLEAELHYDMRGMERTQGFAEGIDTLKKHITQLTGVE